LDERGCSPDRIQVATGGIRDEVGMFDTRRRFLSVFAGAGTLVMVRAASLGGQARPPSAPPPPASASQDQDMDEPAPPLGKSPTKIMLEENQKDIRKNIEKLYQLASDLKKEVEKTDSTEVLSLSLVRKAEEIEKLAHDIKSRAKG
jgi:TolA-binding protein